MAAYYSYQLNYKTLQPAVIGSIAGNNISYYWYSKRGSVLLTALLHSQLTLRPGQLWVHVWHLPTKTPCQASPPLALRWCIVWKVCSLCSNQHGTNRELGSKEKTGTVCQQHQRWRRWKASLGSAGSHKGHKKGRTTHGPDGRKGKSGINWPLMNWKQPKKEPQKIRLWRLLSINRSLGQQPVHSVEEQWTSRSLPASIPSAAAFQLAARIWTSSTLPASIVLPARNFTTISIVPLLDTVTEQFPRHHCTN